LRERGEKLRYRKRTRGEGLRSVAVWTGGRGRALNCPREADMRGFGGLSKRGDNQGQEKGGDARKKRKNSRFLCGKNLDCLLLHSGQESRSQYQKT